jgi:hypothetical protein
MMHQNESIQIMMHQKESIQIMMHQKESIQIMMHQNESIFSKAVSHGEKSNRGVPPSHYNCAGG